MGTGTDLGRVIEHRYLGLVSLAHSLAAVSEWSQLASALSHALGGDPTVRLWAMLDDGPQEIVRYPGDQVLPIRESKVLRRAASRVEPLDTGDGFLLSSLHSAGSCLAVAEIQMSELLDVELVSHSAPLVASRAAALVASGAGGLLLSPRLGDEPEFARIISTFADQARSLLDHDRLSAYLLTDDGRAVERFAVATSPSLPGEGVIVPFADFGLRHIMLTNRALVSEDLGQDPRIVGREDRIIAQAGFRGLLSVPMRLNGRPFGVLNFVSKTAGFYREEDTLIGQQIADQVSVFFEHLRGQRSARAWARHAVVERERARLARELHDTLLRAVPRMAESAHSLAEKIALLDEGLAEQGRDLAEQAESALADTRRALVDLLPAALESHGLDDVVEAELELMRTSSGIAADLEVVGKTERLPLGVRRALYRIVQEALSNVRLHAHASRVDVSLQIDEDLKLVIEDDGEGFDPDEAAKGPGLGLKFMTDRARAHSGRLIVDSAPGQGTVLTVELSDVHQLAQAAEAVEDGSAATQLSGVTLRIYVIEAHALLMAGLTQVIGHEQDMRVVGQTRRGRDAHRQIASLRPDVVLLDADGEPAEVTALAREIKLSSPTSAIIAMSDYSHATAEQLLEHGASGTTAKDVPRVGLIALIHSVVGHAGPDADAEPRAAPTLPGLTLSSRERSVLTLVAAGRTNAEIGKSLFLATKTIERHVATVIDKLGATNRAHAAALAVAHRLVRLDEPPTHPS